MFGPLSFENAKRPDECDVYQTKCLICEDKFNLNLGLSIFLKHVFETHHLIIENVQNIENLTEYVTYWGNRFKECHLEEIVPSIRMDSTDRTYYLLSDLMKEDKELRHKMRLEHVLKIQEFERNDTNYKRFCLFCKLNFKGKRSDFLNHLYTVHNLQLGNPQNLVYIDELVEKVDEKLVKLICLYCDKTFPERNILKEHMRKKLHKQINPNSTEFDKYYIVNYLEPDKNWQNLQHESDRYALTALNNDDDEYDDWNEKEDSINCLFCKKIEENVCLMCLHMEADHGFDFVEVTKNFDFYRKVKLVNYIRRQIHNKRCVYCNVNCENFVRLQCHLMEENHYKIPEDIKTYDQPEYYFPTFENDAFLYYIDDVDD